MVGTMKTKSKLSIERINEEDDGTAKVDYDTILSAAGEFGTFQWIMFFSTCPFYIFGAFTYFAQLFMTETSPNHWCWIPELVNMTDTERRQLAIPADVNSRSGYSQCKSYSANWSEVLRNGLKPDLTWPTAPCQNGWEFNKTEIPYPTIASEMGWVCERDSYQATAQSVFFVGSIVGGFLIGWVADKYGRLPAATCSNMFGCVAGVASIYSRNFIEFAVCRFFVGMAYDNCMMMTYLLSLEYSAPKYRTMIANLPFAVFFTIGITILPWIALACDHWKALALATSVPLALSLLAPVLLPESPRWLLSKGRVDETVKKVMTIARVNKKEIPTKFISQFKLSATQNMDIKSSSLLELLKRPILRKLFFIVCVEYMCCMIVFDVSARTIGQLQFDFFLSFTLVSLTEFPSLVIVSFILDLTGRKLLTIIVMSVCALFSFLTAFVTNGLGSVVCAIMTRFTVNMASNTAMQWCAELLPTPVRGSGLAFVHICGYVATVISPFIAYLDVVAYWLPFVVVGFTAALCSFLGFMLPETVKKDMPQTFDDAENLVRESKVFDFPWSKKEKNIVAGVVNDSFEMN